MDLVMMAGAWLVGFGGLGSYVATVKRRSIFEGVAMGMMLGPIGLLLVALFPQGDRMPPPLLRMDLPPPIPMDPHPERGMGATLAVAVGVIGAAAIVGALLGR